MNRALNIPGLCPGSDAKYFSFASCVFSSVFTYVCIANSGDASLVARNFTDNYDNKRQPLTGLPFSFLSLTSAYRSAKRFAPYFVSSPLKHAPILKSDFCPGTTGRPLQLRSGSVRNCFNYTLFLKPKHIFYGKS